MNSDTEFLIRIPNKPSGSRGPGIHGTVNFGFNDIGFSDKSLITTHFFSPEISSTILYTPYFGYNDMLNNDTLYITTLFLYLMCANHIGYYDFGAFCTL